MDSIISSDSLAFSDKATHRIKCFALFILTEILRSMKLSHLVDEGAKKSRGDG